MVNVATRTSAPKPAKVYACDVPGEAVAAITVVTMETDAMVPTRRPMVRIRLSPSDGKMLAEIHRDGEVVDQRMEEESLVVDARIDSALAGRLRKAGAEVSQNG